MDNLELSATANTDNAVIDYKIEICRVFPQNLFPLVNTEKFSGLCKDGCPNYRKKWSCPPYAPSFQDFAAGWNKLYVLYMRAATDQFAYIKNDYLKVKAANSILKSRADKFLRVMAARNGRFISTGSCRLCKPCKCKSGVICAHPDKMTFSFEALGVDVGLLVPTYFNTPLLWYKPNSLPEYTAVVCGLLTNESFSDKKLHDEYVRCISCQ
jgi:predicted metal-binding protein